MNLSVPHHWGPELKFFVELLASPLMAIDWIFNGDPWVPLKVLLLFLPAVLLCFGLWFSLASLATGPFRSNRTKFVATVMITWWDAGRSVLLYWVGLFRFVFLAFGWIIGALRLAVLGLVQTFKDIILLPLTLTKDMAKNYSKPGIPWIAVMITFLWIALEAMIFSYVLTPMVTEILISLTDTYPSRAAVVLGLFVFLFMIIGGSMACMHGLVLAIEKKQPLNIIKMLAIEFVVMMLEVVFFYREFIESIMPFFNRFSEDGMAPSPLFILGSGVVAWLGVRAGTWFFFGRYGTPTLLMIISREGMQPSKTASSEKGKGQPLSWIKKMTSEVQSEIDWFHKKGVEMTEFFLLPPVQILAVITNFVMLFLTGEHLFNIPLKNMKDVKDTKELVQAISKKAS